MKKMVKVILAAAAVVALAVPAMAADKLIVKNAAGDADVFKVSDTGVISDAIYVGSGGKIGFGAAPDNVFDVTKEWPGVATSNLVTAISVYKDQARYTFRRANNTVASPTPLVSGDTIGNINFRGYVTSGWPASASAAIVVQAGGNFSDTSMPANLMFYTANDTGVAAERLRIAKDGNVGIGSNAPKSKLHVVGLPTYADNTAALAGGLTAGAFYRTATGVLMVTY